MTERSATLSKDPELAQRLLRQEQQNYIEQGEETEEDFFQAGQQESSRGKAGLEDVGGRGVEELCTVSWKEGEEEISSQEEQKGDVKEVDLSSDKEGGPQLFSQSGDAGSAIVQQSEQTC